MGKIEDLTPKDLHCVIAQYEVLTSKEEKALEEVISIYISLRKD